MERIELERGRVIVSTGWVCENMGVSRETVSKWVEKGCPKHGRGKFDLMDVLAWRGMIGGGRDGAAGSGDEGMTLQQKKLAAEVRYKQAQAELGEMRNAVSGGKYVVREELEAELSELFVGIRRACMALPRRVAGLLVGHVGRAEAAEIEAQCETIVRGSLERLSVGDLRTVKAAQGKRRE